MVVMALLATVRAMKFQFHNWWVDRSDYFHIEFIAIFSSEYNPFAVRGIPIANNNHIIRVMYSLAFGSLIIVAVHLFI